MRMGEDWPAMERRALLCLRRSDNDLGRPIMEGKMGNIQISSSVPKLTQTNGFEARGRGREGEREGGREGGSKGGR